MSIRTRLALDHEPVAAEAAPLDQALTGVLLPALAGAGCTRFGSRNVGRVREGILQFVNVQGAAFGPRRFCVNYAVLPLFRPHTAATLSLGDRLRDAHGEDAWWPADDTATALEAMRAVSAALQWQALPWFERTQTTLGLLERLPPVTPASDPHDVFDRACCLAQLGRLREAAHAAARARRLYLRDGRASWHEPAESCAMLFAAALAQRVEPLLLQWQRSSARHLHLGRLAGV